MRQNSRLPLSPARSFILLINTSFAHCHYMCASSLIPRDPLLLMIVLSLSLCISHCSYQRHQGPAFSEVGLGPCRLLAWLYTAPLQKCTEYKQCWVGHEGHDTRKELQRQHTAQTLLKGLHSEEDTWSIFYLRNCPLTCCPLGTDTPGGCSHKSNRLYPDTGLNKANIVFLFFVF